MTPLASVVGAGPVGCLTALGLKQRGYEVVVYERRTEEDFAPPLAQLVAVEEGMQEGPSSKSSSSLPVSKSINLAISVRGLTALSFVDTRLAKTVLDNAVPMRARMIHQKPKTTTTARQNEKDVRLDSQAYSSKGECINSVSRILLSRLLLDEVVAKGIEVRWSRALRSTEFGKKVRLTFEDMVSKTMEDEEVDAVFGCDGHHSKVRTAVQQATGMNVSESTIDSSYVELHIPAKKDAAGGFALDPNHLHIWPRHDYMLIALANRNGSFTSTLFAPRRIFDEHLSDPRSTLLFFKEEFPDAVPLIGEDEIVEQVCNKRPSMLGMVRCDSYNYDAKAILLGDAAHAMVPFYGQGLNCGLEDVRILLELMDRHVSLFPHLHGELFDQAPSDGDAFEAWLPEPVRRAAFSEYSSSRRKDLTAIQELAINNYREMSSNVVRKTFLLRKYLDGVFERTLPAGWWTGLYGNVTFSNMGYHTARQREARQVFILQACTSSFAIATLATTSIILARSWSWWKSR